MPDLDYKKDFIPLSDSKGNLLLHGFMPPLGIFVEFQPCAETEVLFGITAQITVSLPPAFMRHVRTVFYVDDVKGSRTYRCGEVLRWRETEQQNVPNANRYL